MSTPSEFRVTDSDKDFDTVMVMKVSRALEGVPSRSLQILSRCELPREPRPDQSLGCATFYESRPRQ
jgi:hypothetical protein